MMEMCRACDTRVGDTRDGDTWACDDTGVHEEPNAAEDQEPASTVYLGVCLRVSAKKTPSAATATMTVTAQSILPLDAGVGRLVHQATQKFKRARVFERTQDTERAHAKKRGRQLTEGGLAVVTLGAK